MITFDNPPQLENGIDREEYTAIRELLLERLPDIGNDWRVSASVQLEGYGENIHPKPGFEDRFEATLAALRNHFVQQNLYISGGYSQGDPYVQPFDCWDITLYKYKDAQSSYYNLLWDFPELPPVAEQTRQQLISQLSAEQIAQVETKIPEDRAWLASIKKQYSTDLG